MKVSFTHLIAWAIVRASERVAGDGAHLRRGDGKPQVVENEHVNLGIAVDVERRGGRSLMVPCIKGADALDFAGFHSSYEDLITKTRENKLTADDFQGTNISLTNPGGLGTVASVPRLMSGQGTIVATGSIAYPVEWAHAPAEKIKALGVSKVMTMTSTYDHRIIQGAESGSFLRRIDQLLQGEDGFYESVAEALRIPSNLVTNAHPASASAPPLSAPPRRRAGARSRAEPDRELLQAVQAATSLLKAYRTHGHLAARVNPLGGEPKGDPALEPENLNLTPELMARIPASILRIGVEGETLLDALPRMRDAYCCDDRLPDRAPRLAPAADVAAGDDRDRLAPRPALGRREAGAALAADRGVPVRALPAEGLPGPEDVLDRGPRRDRADARRDRHPGAPERRRGGRDRDGAPRPAGGARPQPRALGGVDPGRVRGREGARPGEGDRRDPALGHRRRQVPPRRRGPVHDLRRRPGQDPALPEPEPPRVRRPGGHRRRPRGADRALGAEAAPQPARRGAGAAARRRRLPRPGRGRRDAQPAVAVGLLDRRHDPPDHRQPGRLHHRPHRRALDPVRRRHGEGLQLPDHPRQRRRRRGLRRGDRGWRWPTASSGAATWSST